VTLAIGQVAAQGLAFVRNVIIARMLTQEDMGVAASLALTLSLLEMLSDVAADKLLVQAKDGDDPRLQGVVHGVQFLRGCVQAVLLFAMAWPVAAMFRIPEARWAFQLVALAPLIRGLAHLDAARLQRELRYKPGVLIEILPQALMTAVAWPIANLVGDYGAVLWLVLGQSAAFVVCTHVVATRPYRWVYDRVLLARISSFGWPLLVNAFLLFGINQGDKAIVGAGYTMGELGVYAVAFGLVAAPVMVLGKLSLAMGLPLLSQVQDVRADFEARHRLGAQALSAAAVLIAVPLILAGPLLVRAIYGEKYGEAGAYIGWLAAMGAVRCLRMAPTVASMALGDNVNTMIGNAFRSLALLGMLWAAAERAPLAWIAIASLAGEVLALVVSMLRLKSRTGIRAGPMLGTSAIAGGLLALTGLAANLAPTSQWWSTGVMTACAEVLAGGVLILAFAEVRRDLLLGLEVLRSPRPRAGA